MNTETSAPRRITIVGGGFSGASVAVQLVRASTVPLAITIVEPRTAVGGGLAHSADDPDHRLNGPAFLHYLDPQDPEGFHRWCAEDNLVQEDPGARLSDGSLYVRRRDFGRFVGDTVKAHAQWRTGSTIAHVQDSAVGLTEERGLFLVRTADGRALDSEMVIVATGNALPRFPPDFRAIAAANPAVIAVPTDLERVRAIPKSARVLVLGAGLTALDILSTLVRCGHEGQITAVSRRGLRPASQRPPAGPQQVYHWPDRINGPVAPFLLEAGSPPTVRKLVRVLRERIRQVEAAGDLWYTPYDQVRDCFWQLWPTVPLQEKKRFLKRLRPWFDAFRFRTPPQNEAMVREAEAAGRVVFRTARIRSVGIAPDGGIRVVMRDLNAPTDRAQDFDAVINCTGLDPAAGASDNPFLSSLIQGGWISIDPTGVGFAALPDCSAIGRDGGARSGLRLIGPPINGSFADQVGAAFIAAHIQRALPSMLEALGAMPCDLAFANGVRASHRQELPV